MDIRKKDLGYYNGKNGRKAYIAYGNKVYDVSHVFKDGEHKTCLAGNNLTDILDMMPHGADVVKQAVVVGKLVD